MILQMKRLKQVIEKTYTSSNFESKIIEIKNLKDFSFLELYHGPTLLLLKIWL